MGASFATVESSFHFFASALAPVSYAALIDVAGPGAALALSAALGLVALAGSAALWFRFRAPRAG